MLRKVISVLLIYMMLFSITTPVFAHNASVAVQAVSVSGKAGDTVSVNLKLTKNTGFAILTIAANYDSDVLEFVKVVNKVNGMLDIEEAIADDAVRLFIEEPNEKNYTNKNVIIAELTFKIKKNCAPGTYAITLEGYDDQIDADLNDVALALEDGSVTVKASAQQKLDGNSDEPSGKEDVKGNEIKAAQNAIVLTIGNRIATVAGKQVRCDVAPLIVDGRTYTPARFVAEQLGANVAWNKVKQLVTVTDDGIKIEMTIGSEVAKVNGKTVKMGARAFIQNGRTYTPARFVAEQLGADVVWNETSRQVVITPAVDA